MEDILLKIITILITALIALITVIYKSIIKSIEKNETNVTTLYSKLEDTFNTKFKDLQIEVKENNLKIKEIITRQDTEIQLINKQISLLETEMKYLVRRLNRIEGLDSDHY
jgi:uncharacterized protein YllA (UPF0747 family)